MVHVILLCCAILTDGGKPAEATTADRAAYETAAAKAGKNAAAHVKLALWCETHGLSSERTKHLTIASTLDPSNVLARGLMGLMAFQGNWAKPDQVEEEIHEDPKLQVLVREYLDRRVRTPPKNVDAQLRLAAWCLENGLKDEAMAHYHLVTRLDPSRDIAWLRIGFKKHHDRWFKPDDLAAQKLDAERQKRADTQWKSRLEKLREAMESPVESRRLKAERELYQITDPRAVPMIFKLFGNTGERMQLVAVELLSQIDGSTASFDMLAIGLQSQSSAVRERAAQALSRRDPRDLIGWLVALVRKPFKYELKPGDGPGSNAVLMVDGERFDIRRLYRLPGVNVDIISPANVGFARALDMIPVPIPPYAGNSAVLEQKSMYATYQMTEGLLASALMNEATIRSSAVKQSLDNDIQMLEGLNAQIEQANGRILPLLDALTGQNFGADPRAWQSWWADQLGLVLDDRYAENKPTLTDFVGLPEVIRPHHACFRAGTMVQTLSGPRKIESIAVGDRVVAQNTETGALCLRAVLGTYINGPAETLKIAVDGETIIATGIHRFWKAGSGRTMARDLKAGDHVRKIGGIATIQSIEPGPTEKVFNLTVAENRDFLVGSAGLLVHDYSFVLPVPEPFDGLTNAAPIASR
jgi:hypothetical protein